jgi:hypothetical protein
MFLRSEKEAYVNEMYWCVRRKINSIVSQKNKVQAGMAHHMLQWMRKVTAGQRKRADSKRMADCTQLDVSMCTDKYILYSENKLIRRSIK